MQQGIWAKTSWLTLRGVSCYSLSIYNLIDLPVAFCCLGRKDCPSLLARSEIRPYELIPLYPLHVLTHRCGHGYFSPARWASCQVCSTIGLKAAEYICTWNNSGSWKPFFHLLIWSPESVDVGHTAPSFYTNEAQHWSWNNLSCRKSFTRLRTE